jgi:hypothetical protein
MAVKEAPGDVPNGNDPLGGASYISAAIMEASLGLELNKRFCRKLLGSFVCWLILRHGSQTSKQQGVTDVG